MSESRTPLTQDALKQERKNGKHRRAEQIDNAFTSMAIIGMISFAWVAILAVIFVAVLYVIDLYVPNTIDNTSQKTIESIFTHTSAIGAGYLIHIAKRNSTEE